MEKALYLKMRLPSVKRSILLPLLMAPLFLTGAVSPLPVLAQNAQFDLSSFDGGSFNGGASSGSWPQNYSNQGFTPATQATLPNNYLPQAANAILSTGRTMLPVVSTGSVDFNTVDLPFIRSNGGQGAFSGGPGGGGGTGNGSSQVPPDLPPGYAAVMCHGIYAGAIPPGGNIVDFWNGAYGFAGDAQQQAALLEEGKWLRENGQLDGL